MNDTGERDPPVLMIRLKVLDEWNEEFPETKPKLEKIFYCHKCGASFATFYRLHKHMFKHDFRCAICNYKVGPLLVDLVLHVKRFHTIKEFKLKEEETAKKLPKVMNYYCAHCGKGMLTMYELQIHEQEHKDQTLDCNICYKQFSSSLSLLSHFKEHTVRGHIHLQCKMCPLEFYHSNPLKLHYYTVHNHILNIPYECSLCSITIFDDEEKFLCHVQGHSQLNNLKKSPWDVSKSTCEVCAEILDTPAICEEHKTNIHQLDENSKIICPKCEQPIAIVEMFSHLLEHQVTRAANFLVKFPNPKPTTKEQFKRQMIASKSPKSKKRKREAAGVQPQRQLVERASKSKQYLNFIEKLRQPSEVSQYTPPSTSRRYPTLLETLTQPSKSSQYPISKQNLSRQFPTQLKCTECYENFVSVAALNEHLDLHVLELQQYHSPFQTQPKPNDFLEWKSYTEPKSADEDTRGRSLFGDYLEEQRRNSIDRSRTSSRSREYDSRRRSTSREHSRNRIDESRFRSRSREYEENKFAREYERYGLVEYDEYGRASIDNAQVRSRSREYDEYGRANSRRRSRSREYGEYMRAPTYDARHREVSDARRHSSGDRRSSRYSSEEYYRR
ncbi:unnamed protein product [Ceutorhynchus assimilis]|uniref:C2H2-type domain-containing protein n=1 Tax=Ceutorhynchus assimilis TaxID=467358 RepID=A0A9N9QB44_9CUCU|nr:unnamed protein product [Ceutorhynchus assimilis]